MEEEAFEWQPRGARGQCDFLSGRRSNAERYHSMFSQGKRQWLSEHRRLKISLERLRWVSYPVDSWEPQQILEVGAKRSEMYLTACGGRCSRHDGRLLSYCHQLPPPPSLPLPPPPSPWHTPCPLLSSLLHGQWKPSFIQTWGSWWVPEAQPQE